MTLIEAQRDMRRAYAGGGPGVLVSALVWFGAAWTEQAHGIGTAFAALFIGGMLIFPLSTLASRYALRRAKEAPGNPLGMTALESTIAMIGGLVVAWLFLPLKATLVFPGAAIAVGTHYTVFKTVYGDKLFWALGGVITLIGLTPIFILPGSGGVTLAVAVTEAVFGLILTLRALKTPTA